MAYSNGSNRAKVCALIAALQHEPMSTGQLEVLSGMDRSGVIQWLSAFESAKLVSDAGPAPGSREDSQRRLWAWRFA
jgi:hypothetical protein